MAAQVVPLFHRFQRSSDWTQRELAEFYRVESALIQTGLQLETDRGLSDEGDPWFVFCRADNGEVFIHFARIDGRYIAAGAALDQVVQGRDFPTLVQEMLASQAWVMAKARNQSNVFLHPAALLIALVGASFFHSSEAKAAESHGGEPPALRRHPLPILLQGDSSQPTAPTLDTAAATTILTSVLIGLNELAPNNALLVDWAFTSSEQQVLGLPAPPPAQDTAPSATPHLTSAQVDLTILDTNTPAPEAPAPHPSVNLSLADGANSAGSLFVLTDHIAADLSAPTIHASAAVHADPIAPISAADMVLIQSGASDAAETIQSSNILGYLNNQANFAPQNLPPGTDGASHQSAPTESASSPQTTSSSSGGEAAGTTSSDAGVSTPTPPAAESASSSIVATGLAANSPLVTAALTHFAAEVGNVDVAYSGREIILYDGTVFNSHAASAHADTVTFDFTDGSSISLVGTATEIQNLHLSLS